MVKMFYKSNIYAIVGSNNNPELKQDEVIIWNDLNSKIIYKFLIKKKVLNLILTFDKIIIVCRTNIYVFNLKKDLKNFQLIDIIKTGINDFGLVAINDNKDIIKQGVNNMGQEALNYNKEAILVYPSTEESKGKLTIKNYISKNYIYLNPHNSNISYIALSNDGKLLATASKEGEKIRIFDAKTGEYLDELYRKKENNNNIKFIFFDSENQYIAASCQNGLIHIWSLKKSMINIGESSKKPFGKETENINVSNIHGIISNKESSIKRIILKDKDYENIIFGNSNSLIIITSNEEYFIVKFSVNQEKDDYKIIKKEQLF